jgi:isopentenyl diphosphate isomerase/L-lactate dehydrogenase-like FMN-dependent dehydrogenase
LFGEYGDPYWSTYTSNRAAFNVIKLRPRVLAGVVELQLTTSLVGQRMRLPVILGPTGGLPIDAGEVAEAAAVRDLGTVLVRASGSAASAENLAAVAPQHWWQQVSIHVDRAITEWQVRNAVELGAGALVLTVSNTGDTRYRHHHVPFVGPVSDLSAASADLRILTGQRVSCTTQARVGAMLTGCGR